MRGPGRYIVEYNIVEFSPKTPIILKPTNFTITVIRV
jgi:hypothetical protein